MHRLHLRIISRDKNFLRGRVFNQPIRQRCAREWSVGEHAITLTYGGVIQEKLKSKHNIMPSKKTLLNFYQCVVFF
jgi:hypothetical protein